jgi:hypothetical protein
MADESRQQIDEKIPSHGGQQCRRQYGRSLPLLLSPVDFKASASPAVCNHRALLGFMEAISIAKALAGKTGQRLDPNQELISRLANMLGSVKAIRFRFFRSAEHR